MEAVFSDYDGLLTASATGQAPHIRKWDRQSGLQYVMELVWQPVPVSAA